MLKLPSHFLRHTPKDPAALGAQIESERGALRSAGVAGDEIGMLESAGNLGAMLTSNRKEAEGYEVLSPYLSLARRRVSEEAAAWLVHALATSAQYIGKYDEANLLFPEALQMARGYGWRVLEHFVLHHWGRSLAEQAEFERAKECFLASLAIRQELGDPRQESSIRALVELEACAREA